MPSSRFRHPRSPSIFPILFFERTEAAAASLNTPELLKVCRSLTEAKAFMNVYRDWRYCLRNWPHQTRCTDIERSMSIRTTIVPMDGLSCVYITVRPNPITVLLKHNPELLPIVIDADAVI